jgi:HD-GYP domain-containing protein (c-di-GMP phosphodiesterase class II)
VIRLPPKVIVATLLVAVAPAAAVWALRAAGVLHSFIVGSAIGAALSLGACHLAARVWARRQSAGDVLFGELMIWGWARRCIQQRRLDDAVATLGLRRSGGETDPLRLSVERRAAMLERFAGDLEARDPYTHGHSRRVARYSAMIAKRMGLAGTEIARVRTAAAVHDVGKLETPAEILHRPGKLTDGEFEIVKRHAATGARMVAILEDDELTAIVRHHHERLDGSGYPDGLATDAIPIGARIIAVADTFDAITSTRSYRAARPHREALAILRAESGSQLDHDAVQAFCSVYRGRRPLGAWVALTDLAERVAAWLAPDAVGASVRTVAIAATAAALGGGAVAIPAGAGRPRIAPDVRRAGAITAARAQATAASVRLGSATRAPTGTDVVRGGARRRNRTHSGVAGASKPAAGVHGNPHAPGAGAGGTGGGAGASSGGGSATALPGSSGPGAIASPTATGPASASVSAGTAAGSGPGSPGLHLTVGADPGSSGGGGSVTVSTGSGTASAGVQLGGGSTGAPSVSAGVTLGSDPGGSGGAGGSSGASSQPAPPSVSVSGSGSSGVNAGVSVPGVGSVQVHLG